MSPIECWIYHQCMKNFKDMPARNSDQKKIVTLRNIEVHWRGTNKAQRARLARSSPKFTPSHSVTSSFSEIIGCKFAEALTVQWSYFDFVFQWNNWVQIHWRSYYSTSMMILLHLLFTHHNSITVPSLRQAQIEAKILCATNPMSLSLKLTFLKEL